MPEAYPEPVFDDPRSRLDRFLLGDVPLPSSEETATATGPAAGIGRRLWRALGFPDVAPHHVFTPADLAILSRVVAAVEDGDVDADTAVRLTRAVGQTTARLADWQVAALAERVEDVEAGPEATGSRLAASARLAEDIGDIFSDLLVHAWRRHLAAALARVEALGEAEEDLHSVQVTVGFADLVGFTALSNQLDQDRLGELVEIFETRSGDVVAARGGRIIKTLGDSVLFVAEEPGAAMEIAEGVIGVIGGDPRLPDVRIGLATGSVVTRMGDVFGPPVNMAARLTVLARRNRVVTDEATAELLPPDRYELRRLTERPLRGFGMVEPVAVRRLRG